MGAARRWSSARGMTSDEAGPVDNGVAETPGIRRIPTIGRLSRGRSVDGKGE